MAGRALLLAGLALLLVSCGGRANGVVRITTYPTPDGVRPMVAGAGTGLVVPLSAVSAALPATMPANPDQYCRVGVTVEVTLARGQRVVFGPCALPASIERLRHALIAVAEDRYGLVRARGPVKASEWKAVLRDVADGRMDAWHRCAAVRTAIAHLPAMPQIYSTIPLDLRAYADAVCD